MSEFNLLTVEEVAEHLRVTKKTIYRMLEKRQIPSTRVGHQFRFQRESIEAWLQRNSFGAAAKILVVADDDEVCSLFKQTLEEAGHMVMTVRDSSAVVDTVLSRDLDMVFLDLAMPGKDGAEIFSEIRAARPDLPVTMASAYPESELMARAMDVGPFAVMKKPLDSDAIMAVVRAFLHAALPT